jgi:uncharacterized membrane protein YccC
MRRSTGRAHETRQPTDREALNALSNARQDLEERRGGLVIMKSSTVIRHLPSWVVNGATVTLGLALVQASIGLIAGAQAAQVAIGTAVCASLADVVTTTDRVRRRVLVAALASTASATLFLALRPFGFLLVPAVALIVFGAMLLLSWGPKAGAVAFAAALSLVFAMSTPASQGLAWDRFSWGLAGSAGYWLWAVVTARLLQPTWRNFALASAAEGLASLLAAIARQIGHPVEAAWQSGILDEEAALSERLQSARDLIFASGGSLQARRETALLLHLIDLRDLAMASNLEAGALPASDIDRRRAKLLARIVEQMSAALQAIAAHLRSGRAAVVDTHAVPSLPSLVAELEATGIVAGDGAGSVSSLLQSKLGLLHSIQELLVPESDARLACQRSDLRRYITPDEWRLAAVTANLRPGSPIFRHALRTALTAGVAYALARNIRWMPHPQWIVLTIAAVMQGNLAQTLLRRNARVLGTLVGCVVVVLLTVNSSALFLSACFLVASGVAHAFFGVRYSVTAGAAAVMAVLQAHLGAPTGEFRVFERFADTIAGALLGWAATYLLPTWERQALPAVLRRAMDALRAYAAEATTLRDDATGLPRFCRQNAYDAIRALAAIRSRSIAEPEDVRVPVPQLTSWLTAAYSEMAHLSNIRLTLTLHARECDRPALATAMMEVGRAIDTALGVAATVPQSPPTLEPGNEATLGAVPHLASRIHRALNDAARLASHSAQIETLISPLAPHLSAQHRSRADHIGDGNAAP